MTDGNFVACGTFGDLDDYSVLDNCDGKGNVRWQITDSTGSICAQTDPGKTGWEYPNDNAQQTFEAYKRKNGWISPSQISHLCPGCTETQCGIHYTGGKIRPYSGGDIPSERYTVWYESSDRNRRSIERVSGCPEDPFYRCPAENNMPFQIKVEDGRLTVSMDPARLEGHTIQVKTDPTGMLPTRSRFIASDFSQYMSPTSHWSEQLRLRMDQLLTDDYLKQNLKPGVTTDQLVDCCGFTVAQAESVVAAMDSILVTEQLQAFKPRISVAKDPESNENDNTNAQTTSTTTSTSTTSEKSDSSLLVVVAVAGILVLVAVIALAIFTVKNNKQSQRVVDMRGIQQSSWQKGGAMESDF